MIYGLLYKKISFRDACSSIYRISKMKLNSHIIYYSNLGEHSKRDMLWSVRRTILIWIKNNLSQFKTEFSDKRSINFDSNHFSSLSFYNRNSSSKYRYSFSVLCKNSSFSFFGFTKVYCKIISLITFSIGKPKPFGNKKINPPTFKNKVPSKTKKIKYY